MSSRLPMLCNLERGSVRALARLQGRAAIREQPGNLTPSDDGLEGREDNPLPQR